MRLICAAFAVMLVLAAFANDSLAEQKDLQDKIKKANINKDIKNLNLPDDAKTAKVTQVTKSRMLSTLYIVTVEACAGRERLYSPEIELKSDMDTIRVKIVGLIMPKACKSSDFFIRANNPNSISVGFYTR
ncbi:MAG TPA: hypothetical protein VNK44_01580 [Candidatus Nitrosotenuis sp.]|nr:hypothetical protein [Candidatus Nitrosotenuis sp.]